MFIRPKEDWIACGIVAVVVVVLALLCTGKARAEGIPEQLAVRALVGEAGGQGNEELLAHACALRNRGVLRGVYGLRAPHVRKEPKSTFQRCRKAWRVALAGLDTVRGRTEWLSDYDHRLIRRKWSKERVERYLRGLRGPLKIGETTFYYKREG